MRTLADFATQTAVISETMAATEAQASALAWPNAKLNSATKLSSLPARSTAIV